MHPQNERYRPCPAGAVQVPPATEQPSLSSRPADKTPPWPAAEAQRRIERLEQVLCMLPAGVVVLDGAGYVQQCNPAAVELLGEPLQGLLWRDVIERAFDPRLDDGHEVSSKGGHRLSISTQPLGREPGQILLIKDNTETRLLQERLNHQKHLSDLGEMAASLTHQIRTPLATALLYASHLTQDDLPASERQRFADKLLARLRHLDRLVQDILIFARGGGVGAEWIPVRHLLDQVQQAVEAQVRSQAGTLDRMDSTGSVWVQGHRDVLLTALQNLVTNSLQACGTGARLRIIARRVGEEAVDIVIADNGPGIPPELHERVFEPFFTTRAQGTGLGLAVVRAIAQSHRGAVWVDSRPGQGCAFTLRLPSAVRASAHGTRERCCPGEGALHG